MRVVVEASSTPALSLSVAKAGLSPAGLQWRHGSSLPMLVRVISAREHHSRHPSTGVLPASRNSEAPSAYWSCGRHSGARM